MKTEKTSQVTTTDSALQSNLRASVQTLNIELNAEENLSQCVFIADPWAGDIAIPLCQTGNPDFKLSGDNFQYDIRQEGDRSYLVLSLNAGIQPKAFLEKIEIGNGQSNHKQCIYLACRTAASSEVSPEREYLTSIGKSIKLNGEILSSPQDAMLDFGALYNDGCVEESSIPSGGGGEISGMRYSETISSLSQHMGLDVSKKAKGFLFSGGFTESFAREDIESDKLEYQIDIYRKTYANYHLSALFTIEEMGAEIYLPYITEEANLLLNTPESELYRKYSNSYDGIKALYDKFGTHVLTGGIYGGSFIYFFARKQTCSFHSLTHAAGASLSLKIPNTGTANNWMESYLNAMKTQGGTLSLDGGDYSAEEEEVTRAQQFFVVKGGNGSYDFDKWDDSVVNADSELALIAYGPGGGQDSYLIPLYYLAQNGPRRIAMKNYLDTYLEESAPKQTEVPIVVADFMMKTAENDHSAPIEQKIMQGPDNDKKHIYHPLVLNKNFHDKSEIGMMVDTSSDNFLVTGDAKDQLWWVALDFADECNPITDVAFLTRDDAAKKGFTIRGDDAESGMNWGAIDNHYVALKFAGSNIPPSEHITGVGLYQEWEGDPKIIATSPGTDMLPPYNNMQQFERYWSIEDRDYKVGTAGQGKKEKASWFGENSATHNNDYIFPVYTRTALRRPIQFAKPAPW